MRLKKGVMFRAVDKSDNVSYWKIKGIHKNALEIIYELVPILETLEGYKISLRKAKEENPFLEGLQTLTVEEYAKIAVNREWFINRQIYSLGENAVYLIFDSGQWEENKLICVSDEDSLDDCLWEIQKERSYTDQEMDENIIVREQKVNAWVNPDGIYTCKGSDR